MLTIFCYRKGVILTPYISQGTINAQTYSQVLQDLRSTTWCKQLGWQCKFILLLHDNAHAHLPFKLQNLLWQFG